MSDSIDPIVPPSTEATAANESNIATAKPETPNRTLEFAYRGDGMELGLIMLKNAILAILTLGIYQFWGRTRSRRYIWSQTEIDGYRLHFTGTGLELFIGALKLLGLYLVYGIVGTLIQKFGGALLLGAWSLASAAFFAAAFAVFLLLSARYRFTRTVYRGVRFNVRTNDLKPVVLLSVKSVLLMMVTLGLYFPAYMNRIHAEIINRASFGKLKFEYNGPNTDAFFIWVKGMILSVLTLGIFYPFYRAELMRFRSRHTRFGDQLELQDTIAGMDLLKIYLLGLILIPLTLGLATPWIITYGYRVRLSRLKAWGKLDFADVTQDSQTSPSGGTLGESVVDSLDLNLDIG